MANEKRLDKISLDVMEALHRHKPSVVEVAQVVTAVLCGVIDQTPPDLKNEMINRIMGALRDEEAWGEKVTLQQMRKH